VTDVLVVGGGIAGLSVAWQLAVRRLRVVLLEGEPVLASHSSARNATIRLPTDADSTARLAVRSAELLDGLVGRAAWLTETGALLVTTGAADLRASATGAEAAGLRAFEVSPAEANERAPLLRGGNTGRALWVREAGVLDIHAMTTAIARAARDAGAIVRTRARVSQLIHANGRISGVRLDDRSQILAPRVLLAPGAWAGELGADAGAPVPVVPLRRHLFCLVRDPGSSVIVGSADTGAYFRRESGGTLASPGDEEPFAPSLPPVDAERALSLAERLVPMAPALGEAGVTHGWACLRTFVLPDRELLLGEDPRIAGLFWMAGFGGRGMTVGPAAGEMLARVVTGEAVPSATAMRVDRIGPSALHNVDGGR
jgi:D-arginine dehydrogenase